VGQAAIAEGLVLTVHRRTGEIRLVNPSATTSVEFDGYLIGSVGGALTPATWNSLSAQGDAAFRESNPAATHLGELSLAGSRAVGPASHVSIGTAFDTNMLLQSRSDLEFSYHEAGGAIRSASVEYVGPTG